MSPGKREERRLADRVTEVTTFPTAILGIHWRGSADGRARPLLVTGRDLPDALGLALVRTLERDHVRFATGADPRRSSPRYTAARSSCSREGGRLVENSSR